MSAGAITTGDTVTSYGIVIALAIAFLAVVGVLLMLLGLRWLGSRDR